MYKKAEVEYLRFLLKGLTALRKYAYMRFAQEKQAQNRAYRFGGELLLADPTTQNRVLDQIGGNLTPGTLSNLNRENVERAANILSKGVDVATRVGTSFASQGLTSTLKNWKPTRGYPGFSRKQGPTAADIVETVVPTIGGPLVNVGTGIRELLDQPMPHRPTYQEQQQKARELAERYRR